MTLHTKNNMKALDQEPYMLHLQYHAWLQQELTDLERAGIISQSISNFASLIIIAPKKERPKH